MSRNVVVLEHMGDPAGYSITYDRERRFVVVRLCDCVEIGRYDSRILALTAAMADRDHCEE